MVVDTQLNLCKHSQLLTKGTGENAHFLHIILFTWYSHSLRVPLASPVSIQSWMPRTSLPRVLCESHMHMEDLKNPAEVTTGTTVVT